MVARCPLCGDPMEAGHTCSIRVERKRRKDGPHYRTVRRRGLFEWLREVLVKWLSR